MMMSEQAQASILLQLEARAFAAAAHAEMEQLYEGQPYVVHLDQVVAILAEYGYTSDEIVCAGYLHDTIEDTVVTYDDIYAEYGFKVAEAVSFCTDEKGPNRRTRKALTYERCRQRITAALSYGKEGPESEHVFMGIRVKLADRIANIRSCLATGDSRFGMYRKEKDSFHSCYHVAGVCPEMWDEYDRLLLY